MGYLVRDVLLGYGNGGLDDTIGKRTSAGHYPKDVMRDILLGVLP